MSKGSCQRNAHPRPASGGGCKIASEIPGAELFDNRNHFILFAHQTHVAVYMSIINKLALKSTSRGVKVGILAVTLRDIDDDDRAVGARNIVNFAMSRSEFMRYERLDVYVPVKQFGSRYFGSDFTC